jgi:hypothetical protein
MATNGGKRLDRLEKALDTYATKNKRHHFIVLHETEDQASAIEMAASQGRIKPGDDVQLVPISWKPKQLRGASYIPEGNTDDPLADPRSRENKSRDGMTSGRSGRGHDASSVTLDHAPTSEHLARWKAHEAAISRNGTRYEGDKPKPSTY